VLSISGVIGAYIFAGFSGAAVLFMVAFLNAMARELRKNRARPHRSQAPGKKSLTLVMLDRYRRKELAA
jgi:hypothetical protein